MMSFGDLNRFYHDITKLGYERLWLSRFNSAPG